MRATVKTGLLALPLTLAGCANPFQPLTPTPQAPCPQIALLADGADLTRFRPGAARDLTAMMVDAKIAGFDATCAFAGRDRRAITVRVTPRFEAERGPASTERSADLPWFVALSDANDSTVLERVSGATRVAFPANVGRAQATGRTAEVTVPVGNGLRAQDYILRLSFQLTREELELNRQRGPR
jgi:hypothetical protein